MKYIKRSVVFLVLLIIVGLVGYSIGKKQNIVTIPSDTEITPSVEENFPTLNMPAEYFDVKDVSFSPNGYDVIPDVDSYRSYPTTKISIGSNMYSIVPTDLPPIKTDEEIHEKDPEIDFWGSFKDKSIKKYGNLARRFVGVAGDLVCLPSVTTTEPWAESKT